MHQDVNIYVYICNLHLVMTEIAKIGDVTQRMLG